MAGEGQSFSFDGKGGVRQLGTADDFGPPAKGFVLHLLPSGSQVDYAGLEQTGLNSFAALTAGDDRPRCEPYDDGVMLVLHTLIPDDPPTYKSAILRLWLEKSQIIVIADMTLDILRPLLSTNVRRAPATPGEFAARLALRAANQIEPLVDHLDERLDGIESTLSGTDRGTPRIRLSGLRRSAISIRRHVLPQRDALNTLSVEDQSWLHERDRVRLREAVSWMSRIHAELEAISERANLVREQLVDRRAEQMNRAMLVLAAVATIFMPLTLVTGILGMNVEGIPFADRPWAFVAVVAGLIVIAVLLLAWLRSKRWL